MICTWYFKIVSNFSRLSAREITYNSFEISLQIMLLPIQYVVLGPRLKVINLNILPESSRNELIYSQKIAFMFLSIILKLQVPDINVWLGIRKKATVFDGAWSASQVRSTKNTYKCYRFHTKTWFSQYFMYFFLFLMQLS